MYGGGGEREIIYLSLHCHHQNDSCIKMGNDESHFNVSVGSDGQIHKILVILPKVQMAGYSQTHMHLMYVALHEVTCAWLYVIHRTRRDGSSFMWHQPCQRNKYTTHTFTHAGSHASTVNLHESGQQRYIKAVKAFNKRSEPVWPTVKR